MFKLKLKKMKKIIYIFIISGLFFACNGDDYDLTPFNPETSITINPQTPSYSSGTANFSNFVAVGNSLTAGYSDGALFVEGQENSMPNILAQQFALAGGGPFSQPLMNDNLGGLLLGGQQITSNRLYLSFASGSPSPTTVSGTPSTEVSNVLSGPFNNMGVPGAKSYHLVAPGYGNVAGVAQGLANPYYARMATSSGATVLGDAMTQNPTFFSLWIGNNDILGYATSGGSGMDQTGNLDPTSYGGNDITDPNVFASVYNSLLQGLTANGAKGIVTNLPSITSIPYFTTVPYAALDPSNPDFGAQIPTLNTIFGALNQVYAFLGMPNRSITFSTSAASAVVIKDEDLVDISAQIAAVLSADPSFPVFVQQFGLPAQAAPLVANLLGTVYGQARQANANDLIVLPSSSVIGTINSDAVAFFMSQGLSQELAGQFAVEGITLPLEDKWVLTPEEQNAVETARVSYNQTIESLAALYDLAFLDSADLLQQLLISGISQNGYTTTATYATGGGFSLDGVHPSPRGYAILSNAMIEEINAKYGSNLPSVNSGNYKGVYLQ